MRLLMFFCAIVALSSCTINRSVNYTMPNAKIINSFNTLQCEGSISIITVSSCGTDLHFNGSCSQYSAWCAKGKSLIALRELGFKSINSPTAQYQEWYKP